MPQHVVLIRAIIIAPSDMGDARDAVRDGIDVYNHFHGNQKGIHVRELDWRRHAHPMTDGREPQAGLNEQIVNEADLGIALFGTRLGSPTQEGETGSVTEIKRLREQGHPVMIYRRTGSANLDGIEPQQFLDLHAFFSRIQNEGLYGTFDNTDCLKALISSAIAPIVEKIAEDFRPPRPGSEGDVSRAREVDQLVELAKWYR